MMMTERHYGFRFSGMEGALLTGSVLLASFLIFVSGVYVGREVAGRRITAPAQAVRAPVTFPDEPIVNRAVAANDAATTKVVSGPGSPLPVQTAKEKVPTPSASGVKEEGSQQAEKGKPEPASPRIDVAVAENKAPRAVPQRPAIESEMPVRGKVAAAPVAAKAPVTVAKVPAVTVPRNDKPLTAALPRGETNEKKPVSVTVAQVERIEPPTRSRPPVVDSKRPGEVKSNETKLADVKTSIGTAAKKPTKPIAGWRVQVGATTYHETAQDMARELRELGYSPLVSKVQVNGETLYRVRIGAFNKQGDAAAAVGRFRREGRFSQAYLVSESGQYDR